MDRVFTLSDDKSEISCSIFPPVLLDESKQYGIALLSIGTYNSIPNIEEGKSNKFYYADNKVLTIETGTYELTAINKYLQEKLGSKNIKITANHNTFQCKITCNFFIDFSKPNSIGPLLGFHDRILEPYVEHTSSGAIEIFDVNSINVQLNIASGSFHNGIPDHTIHTFFASVPPGYKLISTPQNLIYFPLNTHIIDNLALRITDQLGRLISFRGEHISVRLHLKCL